MNITLPKFLLKIVSIFLALFALTSCTSEPMDLSEYLSNGVIIDVRTNAEFRSGHIDNAILIPHDQIRSKIGSSVKTKDTPIILYCKSGRRAGIAEKTLRSLGYTQVVNLGGIREARQTLAKESES